MNKIDDEEQQGFYSEGYQILYIKRHYQKESRPISRKSVKLPNIECQLPKPTETIKTLRPIFSSLSSQSSKQLFQYDHLGFSHQKKQITDNKSSNNKIKTQIPSPFKQRKKLLFHQKSTINRHRQQVTNKLDGQISNRLNTHQFGFPEQNNRLGLQKQSVFNDDSSFVSKMRYLFKQLKQTQRKKLLESIFSSRNNKKTDTIHNERLSTHLINLSKDEKILKIKKRYSVFKSSMTYRYNDAEPLLQIKSQSPMKNRQLNNQSYIHINLKSVIKSTQQDNVQRDGKDNSLKKHILMLQKARIQSHNVYTQS